MGKKRYYREWMMECGWGVMLGFDSVMAGSEREARWMGARRMYGEGTFEHIIKVKKKHLKLTDEELSKIYGEQKQ